MKAKIEEYKGVKVIDSYDFYLLCGLSEDNYSRWIAQIMERAVPDKDYFQDPELLKINAKVKKRYWFNTSFAAGLCFMICTRWSLDLRKWLI
jgi:hypothetical protein